MDYHLASSDIQIENFFSKLENFDLKKGVYLTLAKIFRPLFLEEFFLIFKKRNAYHFAADNPM